MSKQYWTGYKPLTLTDLINKVSASIGSVTLAQKTECSNYNGHSVIMNFNDRRGYWIAEYTWAGRQVIARGSFNEVFERALIFHKGNGAAGSLTVYCKDDSNELDCIKAGLTECSSEIKDNAYSQLMPKWIHSEAVSLVHLSKHMPVSYSNLIKAYKENLTENEYNQLKAS